MQQRYATARVPAPGAQQQRQALAADGNGFAAPIGHDATRPRRWSSTARRAGREPQLSRSEPWRRGALLEVVPISGDHPVHTTRNTTVSVERHYLLTVKGNCSETFEALASMPGRRCRALLRGPAAGPWAYRPAPYRGADDARQDAQLVVFRVRVQEHRVRASPHWPPPAAAAATQSRPLGDRVEEPSSPRQDPLPPVWRAAASRHRPQQHRALILHHRRWDNAAQALGCAGAKPSRRCWRPAEATSAHPQPTRPRLLPNPALHLKQ